MRSSKTALGALRDGDWRTPADEGEGKGEGKREGEGEGEGEAKGEGEGKRADATTAMDEEGAEAAAMAAESGEEDERIEGTVAYMPPEVIRGETRPTQGSDAWALGCVAYYCLQVRWSTRALEPTRRPPSPSPRF